MRAAARNVAGALVAAAVMATALTVASAMQTIRAIGCLERDAAARSPIYKLIAKIEGGTRSYRLTTTGSLDLAPYVGKSIDVDGTPTKKTVNGRDEWELAVQSFKVASERCD